MLTSIGRAPVQRVFARSSALRRSTTNLPLRLRPAVHALRTFTASQRSQLATKVSSTNVADTKTKKAPAAKEPTKKKTATKPKAVKKKKAAPKPKPKPRQAKKVLSPEEKLKANIKRLKAVALLDEPKKRPATTWTIFVARSLKPGVTDFTASIRALANEFKSISSYDKQVSVLRVACQTQARGTRLIANSALKQLQDEADKNKLANNADFRSWVEKHTPLEIYEANVARAQLRRKLQGRGVAHRFAIPDPRLPKGLQTAYALFCKARWGEGDLTGKAPDVSRQIAQDWKNLSDSEKKAYEDLAAADHERYKKEMKSVLGKEVQTRPASPSE